MSNKQAKRVRKGARAREQALLPTSAEKRLKAYALAAGAAGVGLLALAPAAKADIIPISQPFSYDINKGVVQDYNLGNGLWFSDWFSSQGYNHDASADAAIRGTGGVRLGITSKGALLNPGPLVSHALFAPSLQVGRAVAGMAGPGSSILLQVPGWVKSWYATGFFTYLKGHGSIGVGDSLGFKFPSYHYGWAFAVFIATGSIKHGTFWTGGGTSSHAGVRGNIGTIFENTCAGQGIAAGQEIGGPCTPPPPPSVPEPSELSVL